MVTELTNMTQVESHEKVMKSDVFPLTIMTTA